MMIKEYTMLAVAGTIFALALDFAIGTKIFTRKIFWAFWTLVTAIMLIVNGWLTWRPIVIYNEDKMLGFRIFTIPVEDFFFGFALLGLNLIIWEYFSNKAHKQNYGK